jgi:hypothetical protein
MFVVEYCESILDPWKKCEEKRLLWVKSNKYAYKRIMLHVITEPKLAVLQLRYTSCKPSCINCQIEKPWSNETVYTNYKVVYAATGMNIRNKRRSVGLIYQFLYSLYEDRDALPCQENRKTFGGTSCGSGWRLRPGRCKQPGTEMWI